jgi:S1-C subfamily serine protease
LSTAKLAGRRLSGERAARFKMMSRLGAIPSRRADGFPVVFQHDAPLFPEQCGGPIVDLDGAVIGMNIARNGRAASYAIPSNHLQTLIENFKQISIAQRISENIQN